MKSNTSYSNSTKTLENKRVHAYRMARFTPFRPVVRPPPDIRQFTYNRSQSIHKIMKNSSFDYELISTMLDESENVQLDAKAHQKQQEDNYQIHSEYNVQNYNNLKLNISNEQIDDRNIDPTVFQMKSQTPSNKSFLVPPQNRPLNFIEPTVCQSKFWQVYPDKYTNKDFSAMPQLIKCQKSPSNLTGMGKLSLKQSRKKLLSVPHYGATMIKQLPQNINVRGKPPMKSLNLILPSQKQLYASSLRKNKFVFNSKMKSHKQKRRHTQAKLQPKQGTMSFLEGWENDHSYRSNQDLHVLQKLILSYKIALFI